MHTIVTNYATYDLAYYYADLKPIPRFSDEERQRLMSETTPAQLLTDARNRLIEGHLHLAKHIAIKTCPPTHAHALPDLIGEVNLTLVKLAHQYDFHAGGNFTAYFAVCAQGAVKRTLGNDRLIRVPSSTVWRAKQKGTDKALYELQPDSLDEWMKWFQTSEIEEPPTTSLLPTDAAPPRDPQLRAHVQTWLSYLPPRTQRILTLRYGLADEDERCWTTTEIADAVGVKRKTVEALERDAKKRIQALVEGTATIVERNGQRQIQGVYTHTFKPPTLTPAHEATLMQEVTRLCEQGMKVTSRSIATATGLSVHLTQAFLRLHRDDLSLATREKALTQQKRLAHIAHIYADLEATGEQVTTKKLAQAAHVAHTTALAFLRTRKEERHAAQAR